MNTAPKTHRLTFSCPAAGATVSLDSSATLAAGQGRDLGDTSMATRALLSVSTHRGKDYLVVKCPIGHLIEATLLDRNFGGTMTEADWSAHQHGHETRWDRIAAKCDGAGHERDLAEAGR